MAWVLVCTTRDDLRVVLRGTSALAGRHERANLRLPAEDLRASRRHAVFELVGDGLEVRDLGSTGGTWVNDRRVERSALAEGDVVRLGTLRFRVEKASEARVKELRLDGPVSRRVPVVSAAPVARTCHLCGARGVSPGGLAPELDVAWICEACADARRTTEGSPEPLPKDVAGWDVLRFVDRGGMSIVFEARHRVEGVHGALKLLRLRHPLDDTRRRRFTREQQLVAALSHPNIVRAFEIGDDDASGEVFIASELVTGGDAEQLAAPDAPLPVVLRLAADLFAALAHAHEHGVVHRDVKPPNLLLQREAGGVVRGRLADFGLAKSVQDLGEDYSTVDGEVAGSVEFMAPEQALALADAGVAADLYSAGATLYYLLTEKLPFPDAPRAPTRLALATVMQARVPLRTLRPDVPDEVARWIDLLVSREPERRAHLTARELAARFSEIPGG